MTAGYILGLDLGTTNSVLAYTSLAEDRPRIEVLPIPQLVAVGLHLKQNAITLGVLFA